MAKRTYINADEELIIQGKLILEGNIEQRQFVHNVEFTQQDFAGDILVVNSGGVDTTGSATDGEIRIVSGSSYGSINYSESANIVTFNANVASPYFIGAISSADGLTSAVNIVLSTDATGSSSFQNGGDTATIPVTLATVNTDVTSPSTTYGNATHVARVQINPKGLVTASSVNEINIPHNQITDFDSAGRALISVTDSGGDGSLAYNSTTGVITYTGPSASEVQAHFSAGTNTTYSAGTFDITDSTIRSKVSATDAGGDGSFAYNSGTGVFTYTGPSQAEVLAHISGGTGISIDGSGVITTTDSEIIHDDLSGFVADEHIAHSGVTLTAGAGLTGGGTIAASRSFAVGQNADDSIIVNADDVQLNVSYARGLVDATDAGGDGSFSYNDSTGIFTYTGPSASEVRAHFSAGTGIEISSGVIAINNPITEDFVFAGNLEVQGSLIVGPDAIEDVHESFYVNTNGALTYTHNASGAYYAVAKGDGIVLTANTVAVGAGDGITVNANDVQVDSTVIRTTGDQSIAGVKTFTGTVDLSGATVPSFTVTGNLEVTGNVNSLNYVDLQVQNSEIILNSNVSIAQDAFIKVERGGTGSDTYIKWDEGSDRWQFSNDGSTDNNMLLFSDFSAVDSGGDGSFSYSNGAFTYTGPSSAEVQAHFSAGTNTTYSAGTFDITDSTIRSKVSATDAGGDGSFSYNSTSGAFTYTGPSLAEVQARIDNSAANVQAHFSAGTNTTYSAGVFDITNTTIRSKFSVTDNGGDGSLSYSNGVFTYTGPSQAEVLAHISGGTGIAVSGAGVISTTDSEIVHDNLSGFVLQEHIDHRSVNLIAGTGLTGGGNITTDRTFNVVGGDGITANADDIQVDNTVIRTTGNQTVGGVKTFSDTILLPNSATNTDRAIYTDNANSKAYVYLNGSAIEITPAVDAGDVEAVGSGDVNIYAGSRASGNTIIHGIKSISDSTYSTISEASNVITVDANISAIRGAFSAVDNAGDGTFSYNSNTGVFSYSGVSQSQIRGEFSASGGELSYNSSTGVFTSTADNYSNWILETDSGAGSAENITSQEKITIQGGTNISVTNTGNVVTITNDNSADITAVTAGTGLTGGGNSGAISLAVDNSHVRGLISASGDLSYNSTTGVISFTQASAPVTSVNSLTGAVVLDTGDIAESGNLYYTDARARAAISVSGDLSYNSTTGVISFTNDAGDIESVTAGSGLTGGGTSGGVTLNVGAGTGITVNANDVAVDMSAFSTTNLSEGTNLYFTNARADARVSNALSGDVTIGGNLTVSGTQTILNTETLTVDDNIIVLNNNVTGTPSQDAGIEVERGTSTNVRFQYKESTDRWQFTNDGSTYFNLPTSTADVAEFSNLYFTNARARSALSVSGDLSYNSGTGVFSFTERTDAEVRGLVSGTGLISYNNGTGVISTTADNYSSWTFMEGNGTETGTVGSGQTMHFEQGTGIQVEKTADRQLTITNTAPDQTVSLTGSGSVSVSGTYPNFTINGTDTDTNTTYSAGTDLSLSGTTFNVDSATAATASTLAKRDGSGNLTANIFNGTATSARYADLAEIYSADASYDPGTVLVIGGNAEVTVTDEPGSYQAVGVVSTDPAYLMNSEANGVAVALRGRVPCKVAGVCKKGDVLITSDLPGHAMVAADPKSLSPLQIIGRALANKTEAAPGVVEILV